MEIILNMAMSICDLIFQYLSLNYRMLMFYLYSSKISSILITTNGKTNVSESISVVSKGVE